MGSPLRLRPGAGRRTILRGCALAAFLVASAGAASATNGPRLTAKGARAAGRGGVDYGYADDGIGPASNPAGMAFVWGNRLDNNWVLITKTNEWRNSFGAFDNEAGPEFPLPAFSVGAYFDPQADWRVADVFKLGDWGLEDESDGGYTDEEWEALAPDEKRYGSRWRIGFGVFPITGGEVSVADMRTSAFPDPVDWQVEAIAAAITPSVAYRFNEYVSLGVNLQIIHSRLELDGGIAQPKDVLRDDFETAQNVLSVNDQILTKADIDDAFTWGFSWRMGLMVHPAEFLSIGFTYQDRSYTADYLGRATVSAEAEVNRLSNGNPSLLQVVEPRIDPSLGFTSEYDLRVQDYEFPRQVGLGVVLRPGRRISIGLDYTWLRWSETSETLKARLSGGSNPNLDLLTAQSVPVRVPLNYDDQHVIAVGVTGLLIEGDDLVEGVPSFQLIGRAGYNYAKSPVPEDTTLPQLPVITEHHVSAGFTFRWGPLVEFSFAWEWALPNEYETGVHEGDFTLSDSEHEVELMLFHFGIGVNF